jgi:hypothetical protein
MVDRGEPGAVARGFLTSVILNEDFFNSRFLLNAGTFRVLDDSGDDPTEPEASAAVVEDEEEVEGEAGVIAEMLRVRPGFL